MEIIPIKTRALLPPQDSLYDAILGTEPDFREGDVVVISAKVVSIDEGRVVGPVTREEKMKLAEQEADVTLPSRGTDVDRYIIHHTFIGWAGVDECNANGHTILLPKEPGHSSERLCQFIQEQYGLERIAVIIADSHSSPMRMGATGIAIGFYGLEPIIKHRGKKDVFGREIRFTRSNVVDGMAAGAVLAMGETNEQTPLAIVRGVAGLEFAKYPTENKLFVPPEEDWFGELYQNHLK